jgi:tetratricopeptide (TPR) repeat protein
MEGAPADLQKAGLKALQNKDYKTAAGLFKRAIDGDTAIKDGWYDLGQAYAGTADHPQAIAAFRQQIKVDPNHKRANGDLAMELQQSGNNDEAIAAYRKQLEVSPYDKLIHKNLGTLLAQLHRDADARPELEAAAAIPPGDPEIKLTLSQVYARLGENSKAQPLMQELTGSASADANGDIFAAALKKNDIDQAQAENDAQQVLYDIGGQFDSGEFDKLGPAAFSAMRLVALSWARIGWARFERGENLPAMQFLTTAWLLSQSGTVANRLAQVLEKQGQTAKAQHMYALSAAVGGGTEDAQNSRAQLAKLLGDPAKPEKAISQAREEWVSASTVKLGRIATASASAHFNLLFDGSPRPERAEFAGGEESLRSAAEQLREKDFPVKFPEVSSVKIVRQAQVSCNASSCQAEIIPIDKVSGAVSWHLATK